MPKSNLRKSHYTHGWVGVFENALGEENQPHRDSDQQNTLLARYGPKRPGGSGSHRSNYPICLRHHADLLLSDFLPSAPAHAANRNGGSGPELPKFARR